jgi:hypothetical protein
MGERGGAAAEEDDEANYSLQGAALHTGSAILMQKRTVARHA